MEQKAPAGIRMLAKGAHIETVICQLSSLGWKAKMSEVCRVAQGVFSLESYAWGVALELREAERP